MQNVNLLDRRLVPVEPLVPTGVAVALIGIAALGVCGHGLVEQQLTRRALAAVAAGSAVASEVPAADAAAGAAAPLVRLRDQVAEREALLAALRSQAAGPANPALTLAQVITALPATMWLTDIEMHGARELRIGGHTLDPLSLADFASRLSAAEGLRGLPLQTLRLEPVEAADAAPAANALRTHRFVLASQDESAQASR